MEYTPKKGHKAKIKGTWPKLPHEIGRGGEKFMPSKFGDDRGSGPSTWVKGDVKKKGK